MDKCIRGTAHNGDIRFWVANTTELCNIAQKNHDTWPVATAALGRLLTATLFLGLGLKGKDRVSCKIAGDGPLGSIIAVANAKGEVKGCIDNPHVDIPRSAPGKLDVGSAVGKNGTLQVIKDMGLKQSYTGTVKLVTGEIGDDFSAYLLESEQIPSSVGLGVLVDTDYSVKAAGGYMIQLMPGADKKLIDKLENNIRNIDSITKMIDNNFSSLDILEKVLKNIDFKVLDELPVNFVCECNKDRFSSALISLGRDELKDLAKEGEAEIICNFCNKKYLFDSDELLELEKNC